MRFHCDCFQCVVKHALESARSVTRDEGAHLRVLREVMRRAARLDARLPPPVLVQAAHRVIRRAIGDGDPYRRIKKRHNALVLKLLPRLEKRVRRAKDPFAAAVRLAIAGNRIDMGTRKVISERDVLDALESALSAPLIGETGPLLAAARRARRILYLADNAGEIVLDRLLVERLPMEKLTLAVRGAPILNDALLDDARAAGLTDRVPVIGNGSDAPGTVLADCSRTFRKAFSDADLVIAKGQGNYETLSETDKRICFLLVAKCDIICQRLGHRPGEMLIVCKD
ncbi:MAG: ARMT1-like domain-containing protein [Elusimicrobiota bacterium]